MQVPSRTRSAPRARKAGPTSALSQKCGVCGRGLTSGRERKLRRHLDCPASYDEALFDALKAWRRAQAEAQSMPAFVVFTDATLIAVAEAGPRTPGELARIPGIGPAKLERYGTEMLALLAERREREQ